MNTTYTTMTFERTEEVLTVVFNDPTSTAMSEVSELAIHEEMAQLFRDLRDEPTARAVVLTGGGNTFLTGLNDPAASLLWQREQGLGFIDSQRKVARRIIWDLLEVEIPVVAALNVDAVGFGATIALFCDAIFIADSARISDPHVQLGVVAGDGGAAIWPLAVGPAMAKRYLLTGDPLTATDAERIGLVTHVSSDDRVVDDAIDFAARLAYSAPLAVRYTKLAINLSLKERIAPAFELGLSHELLTFVSDDMAEALHAAREARRPTFRNR